MSQLMIVSPDTDTWAQSFACANFLLREGVEIVWATQPFQITKRDGSRQDVERGAFLITETPADGPDWLDAAARRYDVPFIAVDAVDGFEGVPLTPLRIGMYGGGGAPFNHARIFAELGFTVDFIMPEEIKQGKLTEIDVLGMPGGGGLAMKGQLDPLGIEGCRAITEFVRSGGMYMGSCAGSYDAAIAAESFVAVCPQQREMELVNAAVWNRDDTEWVGIESPGVGVLESRNVRPDHPVMFGLPETFRITHYNGPFFESCSGAVEGASDPIGLAAVTGFTDRFTPSEHFLAFSEFDQASAQDTTLIGRAAQEERFNIIVGHNGLGRVVLFGSHPEFGYNLAMDRWDVPARMLANAAFWQAGHLTHPRPQRRKATPGTVRSYPPGSGLRAVSRHVDKVTTLVQELRDVSQRASPPAWLAEDLAMSTFGLSGAEIWRKNLAAFIDVAEEVSQTIDDTETATQAAHELAGRLHDVQTPSAVRLRGDLQDALFGLEEAIHFRVPDEWHQDFGYEGVLQLLERAEAMVQKALTNVDASFDPSPNPYEYFDSSPFQLVSGSYLAAIGVFANAWFLLRVHECWLAELVFKARTIVNEG